MPDRDNFWVFAHSGGWAVKREGEERVVSSHAQQSEAWDDARRRAEECGGEAYLQASDGTIRERSTYGHDPRDIPG